MDPGSMGRHALVVEKFLLKRSGESLAVDRAPRFEEIFLTVPSPSMENGTK